MAHCLYWMFSDTLKHMLLRHASPLYCKQRSGFWLPSDLSLIMKHGPSKYSASSLLLVEFHSVVSIPGNEAL